MWQGTVSSVARLNGTPRRRRQNPMCQCVSPKEEGGEPCRPPSNDSAPAPILEALEAAHHVTPQRPSQGWDRPVPTPTRLDHQWDEPGPSNPVRVLTAQLLKVSQLCGVSRGLGTNVDESRILPEGRDHRDIIRRGCPRRARELYNVKKGRRPHQRIAGFDQNQPTRRPQDARPFSDERVVAPGNTNARAPAASVCVRTSPDEVPARGSGAEHAWAPTLGDPWHKQALRDSRPELLVRELQEPFGGAPNQSDACPPPAATVKVRRSLSFGACQPSIDCGLLGRLMKDVL